MGAGRSRARGWRFNFGFGGNGILHDIPFWRVQAAIAKGMGKKTLPRVNTDETDPKKAGRRSSRRRGRLRSITWGRVRPAQGRSALYYKQKRRGACVVACALFAYPLIFYLRPNWKSMLEPSARPILNT